MQLQNDKREVIIRPGRTMSIVMEVISPGVGKSGTRSIEEMPAAFSESGQVEKAAAWPRRARKRRVGRILQEDGSLRGMANNVPFEHVDYNRR